MSKEPNEFQEFRSDKLMRGLWEKPPIKPIRSEETRKRLADLEERRTLEKLIGEEPYNPAEMKRNMFAELLEGFDALIAHRSK